ncbi:MAG: flagellar hook-length control protein FliK [Syntrophomonadaceae bacterium]|nr:flagellar hook-length control protein FliK [Syntrophomonadaceae bacterium]
MPDKLSTAKQELAETKPLLNETIQAQLEMTADKQGKTAHIEIEAEIISNREQLVKEALTLSEPQATSMASLMQTGLAGKQIAKTAAPNNSQAADQEFEITVTQTNLGDQKTMISSEADKAAVTDKAIQMTANKEAGISQGKNELNYNTAAGHKQEAASPKTESAATDIKKLIEFESKRPQSGKAEVTQLKNEVAPNQKAEGEASSLLLGKTAMETEKTQIFRNVNTPTPANLTAEPEQVLEQLVKKAELMVKLNSSEMKIQLQPEFLGKMTIKIILEEGLVTAKFITDSHQVKHMLESNLNTLKQSLEAQGIRVEKTEVNVQLNNGGMFDGSNQNSQESWQRHQFMSSQSQQNYTEQGYQTGTGNDDFLENSIIEQEYGIDSNGTMNFLV